MARQRPDSRRRATPDAAAPARVLGSEKKRQGEGRPSPSAPVGKDVSGRWAASSTLLAGLVLASLVVLAYANSLGNGFVWDDHQQIVMNPAMKADAPLAPIFTADVRFARHGHAVEGSDYRPLQMLTYRLLVGGFGADATAFHVCSLLFMVGCTLAAFAVFRRLVRRPGIAFAAAALFAVYPVHTEAVDWIAALPELGCALFLLLSFWAWLVAAAKVQARWLWLACSWLAFGAALLWKETALVFPVLLGTYFVLNTSASIVKALKQTLPYWGVLVLYIAVRYAVLAGLAAGPRDWELSGPQMLWNVAWLMVTYWAKLAVPFGLNAYSVLHPIRSLSESRGMAAFGFLLAAAVAVGAGIWRRVSRGTPASDETQDGNRRLLLFAVAWVFITILPALDLAALGRNAFAERYLFLPSAGFCLLLALAGAWLASRVPARQQRIAASLLLLFALAGCMAATVLRNPDWKDDATLFGATLERSHDAPFVRNMVAAGQSSDPATAPQAEENYRAAMALADAEVPADRLDAVVAYQGLASVLADRGEFQQALAALDAAGRLDPDDADTDGARGLVLARAGNGLEAEPLLRRALAKEPNSENVLAALGTVTRDDLHRPTEAVRLFERALAVHPAEDDFAASQHNNLGAAYADAGDYAAAIQELRQAVRILPNDPEFHINLATAFAAAGRYPEARAEAQVAVQLAPNDPMARELLDRLGQQQQ